MVRHSTFDPTDDDAYEHARQRFDWALLRSGSVARYGSAFHFEAAQRRLGELGYRVHLLDAASWHTTEDLHDALAAALAFPAWYGRNLDALDDLLDDVAAFRLGGDSSATGTVLAIDHFERLCAIDRRTAAALLDIYARHARFAAHLGHPMLCLVASADGGLAVGGHPVAEGPRWDVEPEPPMPFTESDVVSIVFQVVADAATADRCVAALSDALDRFPRVGTAARPATREEASNFHRYDPRVREEGATVYRLAVGLRGSGDLEQLVDELDARLRAMLGSGGESFYHAVRDPAPTDPVLAEFPDLA